MSTELILHAPFDFHYELDIRKALRAGPHVFIKALEQIISEVQEYFSEYSISVPSSTGILDSQANHDGRVFRSRHNRLPFLLSVTANPASEFYRNSQLCDSKFQVNQISWSIQEYGYGTVEIRLGIDDCISTDDGEFLQELIVLCNKLDPICRDFLNEFFIELGDVVGTGSQKSILLASDAALLAHRISYPVTAIKETQYAVSTSWFHATLVANSHEIMKNSNETGNLAQREPVLIECAAPKLKKPYRLFFGWNHVAKINFGSRDAQACIFVGWGNSVLVKTSDRKDCCQADADVPLSSTMHMVQSFSAAISNLNYQLLREAYLLETKKKNRISDYRENAEKLESLQYKSSLFLSLIDEQRSSLAPSQRSIWDACSRAWMLRELEDDLRNNISLLKNIYSSRRNLLQDALRRRLEYSLAFISVASASAIAIEIIKNFSEPKVNYELVTWQVISVVVMMIFAAFLFITPGKRKDIEA